MLTFISMIKPLQFVQSLTTATFFEKPLSSIFQIEPLMQIKEFILDIFARLAAFFRPFTDHSKEMNLKPIAMISFLSLITLLVISIFTRREQSIVPPPTPMKKDIEA